MPTFESLLKVNVRRAVAAELRPLARRLARMERKLRSGASQPSASRRSARRRTKTPKRVSPEGRAVRALRLKLDMARTRFAKLVGVTPAAIFFWEHGQIKPSPANWKKIQKLQRQAAAGKLAA